MVIPVCAIMIQVYHTGDGPFDIEGGWQFLKNSLFPYNSDRIKMFSMKLKIKS